MNSTITTRLPYLIFSVVSMTACSSPFAAVHDASADKTAISVPANKDRENAIQQWIKARAEYEETLDFSTLEEDKEYEYRAMRSLVEAKYFLTIAEKDLKYNSDKTVALDDFDQARQLLEKAMLTANVSDRKKIEAIHERLDNMRLAVKRDISAEARWMPLDQRSAFDAIFAQLEEIIKR